MDRRIVLIVDNEPARQALSALFQDSSYILTTTVDVSENSATLLAYLDQEKSGHHDLWLVDISQHHNDEVIELLLDRSSKPMLLNDDLPIGLDVDSSAIWRKRLLTKLETICIEEDKYPASEKKIATDVWVLAASLGGPEMVKRFLMALPKGLPIAFVYVQHIEAQFDRFLSEGLGTQQAYPLKLIEREQKLVEGETLLVPADYQLRFLPFGSVVKTQRPWEGSYQPSIDQVVSELAKEYRKHCGVIVFSGTCDDGSIGCRVVKACGGTVWAQSPDSCISPGMPEMAIETGCVSSQGSPEMLARQLSEQYGCEVA